MFEILIDNAKIFSIEVILYVCLCFHIGKVNHVFNQQKAICTVFSGLYLFDVF